MVRGGGCGSVLMSYGIGGEGFGGGFSSFFDIIGWFERGKV